MRSASTSGNWQSLKRRLPASPSGNCLLAPYPDLNDIKPTFLPARRIGLVGALSGAMSLDSLIRAVSKGHSQQWSAPAQNIPQ